MIETSQYGPVTRLIMGRELDGKVLYRVAAYLVDGLLIDTGCRHTAAELVEALRGREVRKVYCTHYHEDHIGGNRLLQEQLKVKVWAHPRTVNLIPRAPALYPYQDLVWGYPEPAPVLPLDGDCIRTAGCCFQVLETPGHSEDHTALVEPERGWCFSGDLFVSEQIKVLRPEEDARTIMRSMEKLLALPYRLTLLTSIGRIIPQGKEALRACLEHLRDLQHRAGRLQQEGLAAPQIVERLFGGESSLAALTGGQFAAENLVKSLLKAEP